MTSEAQEKISSATEQINYETESLRWIAETLDDGANGYDCGLARILRNIAEQIEGYNGQIQEAADNKAE